MNLSNSLHWLLCLFRISVGYLRFVICNKSHKRNYINFVDSGSWRRIHCAFFALCAGLWAFSVSNFWVVWIEVHPVCKSSSVRAPIVNRNLTVLSSLFNNFVGTYALRSSSSIFVRLFSNPWPPFPSIFSIGSLISHNFR